VSSPSLSRKNLLALSKIVGKEHVSASDLDRLFYSRDAMSRTLIEWRRGKPKYFPHAIVWPANTLEVSRLVRWANEKKIPVIAYGGGSGVSGGTLPLHGGLIIDLKRMSAIEQIDEDNNQAVVQSGIISQHLETALQSKGFTLGHFPSSILVATMGGCIAARGAGQMSTKYGVIEDMVDALEVVLPSGDILPFDAETVPGLPGVAPCPLFIGSEGTLGIVTRCRVRLHRKAMASRYRAFSFARLSDAIAAMRTIMQTGMRPSVVRLYDPLDSLLLEMGYSKSNGVKASPEFLQKIVGPLRGRLQSLLNPHLKNIKDQALAYLLGFPRILDSLLKNVPVDSLLIVGFQGDNRIISWEESKTRKICKKNFGKDHGSKLGLHWLDHRYSVSFKMPKLFMQGNFVDTIEIATTWDRVQELYDTVRKELSRYCLVLAHFSHAYHEGSSIYFTIVGRESSLKNELSLYDRAWESAMQSCLEMGATITHHHGVGILKGKFMRDELGALMDLFQTFKLALDPHGIMNPGKMGLDGKPGRTRKKRSYERMTKLISRKEGAHIDEFSLIVHTAAKLPWKELEEGLNEAGFTLGYHSMDHSEASIQDLLEENHPNTFHMRYGHPVDMCVSVMAKDHDHTILETKLVPRTAAGPDFKRILLGNGRIFGNIEEASLRIHHIPEKISWHWTYWKKKGRAELFLKKLKQRYIVPSLCRIFKEGEIPSEVMKKDHVLLILRFEGLGSMTRCFHARATALTREMEGSVARLSRKKAKSGLDQLMQGILS
jgi:alkyldihydroxyacetonephosphate synthase